MRQVVQLKDLVAVEPESVEVVPAVESMAMLAEQCLFLVEK